MSNVSFKKPDGVFHDKATYICGVDLARTGQDETAIVVIEEAAFSNKKFVIFMEAIDTPNLVQAIGRVAYLDKVFHFKRILVDETGLGAGATDVMREELGNRVRGIVFTNKSKADMFNNLKMMMQNKLIYIPDYLTDSKKVVKKLYFQLLGITQEWTTTGNLKITHDERDHDDLVCALALASYHFNTRKKTGRGYALASGGNK